jgi:hypothetical protein
LLSEKNQDAKYKARKEKKGEKKMSKNLNKQT